MYGFSVELEADGDGYSISLDVNPTIMNQTDGRGLIKKLCNDIIDLIDEAPLVEDEEE